MRYDLVHYIKSEVYQQPRQLPCNVDISLLGRLIVVGRYNKTGISSGLLGFMRQINGFNGRIGTGACNNWNSAANIVNDGFNNFTVFIFTQRC